MNYRRSLLLILSWVLIEGCAASKSNDSSTNSAQVCVGVDCQVGVSGKASYNIWLSTAGAGVAGTSALKDGTALCAVQNPSCDPDDATSCSNAAPTIGQGGTASGKSSPSAGSGVLLPSDFAPGGVAGNVASAIGASGIANALGGINLGGANFGGSNVSGSSGSPVVSSAGAVAVAMACRVQRDQVVTRTTCEPAGQGTLGAPCVSRANCAAGFACVEENGTAQCRPYCCRGVGSCPIGTFCDQRSTKELVTTNERLTVSVCMPGVDCRFDDYPCPTDKTCSCPSGKACGVVRSDGTTACVVPGSGTEGQPCPCAAQHVCSEAIGSCFKVCSLTSRELACTDGFCQASASLSSDWGLCVRSASLL